MKRKSSASDENTGRSWSNFNSGARRPHDVRASVTHSAHPPKKRSATTQLYVQATCCALHFPLPRPPYPHLSTSSRTRRALCYPLASRFQNGTLYTTSTRSRAKCRGANRLIGGGQGGNGGWVRDVCLDVCVRSPYPRSCFAHAFDRVCIALRTWQSTERRLASAAERTLHAESTLLSEMNLLQDYYLALDWIENEEPRDRDRRKPSVLCYPRSSSRPRITRLFRTTAETPCLSVDQDVEASHRVRGRGGMGSM